MYMLLYAATCSPWKSTWRNFGSVFGRYFISMNMLVRKFEGSYAYSLRDCEGSYAYSLRDCKGSEAEK
jgi:hypothetical protein